MKFSKSLNLIAAAALSAGLMLGSAAAETIRVGHADNEAHPKHQAFLKFKELVEAASGGEIEVDIFPGGQLGGEREMVEALQTGALHITCVSNGVMSAFSKPFMMLDIPFLFQDVDTARSAIDGAQSVLFSELDQVNLHGLAVWEQGFRELSSSGKPVRSLEDVKGMKLRTMEAPLHVMAWKSLGANPTPMSWGQVYTSLQTGVIDGQENPLYVVTQENLFEVQKFVSLTNHIYDAMPVVAGADWWTGLSEEQKNLIEKAMAEATAYERGLVGEEVAKARMELGELGVEVVEVPAEVLSEMKTKAQASVVVAVKEQLGDELVSKWLATVQTQ